jgi:hypothetical protein
MSQRFLEHGLTVGYDYGEKKLVATVTEKMAKKMKADGWQVHYEKEIGHFVTVTLQE